MRHYVRPEYVYAVFENQLYRFTVSNWQRLLRHISREDHNAVTSLRSYRAVHIGPAPLSIDDMTPRIASLILATQAVPAGQQAEDSPPDNGLPASDDDPALTIPVFLPEQTPA